MSFLVGRDMRIMMDHSSENPFAILRIATGIQNVLMPEQIQVLVPRRNRDARVLGQKAQEQTVITFRGNSSVGVPTVPLRTLGCNEREIQRSDGREL